MDKHYFLPPSHCPSCSSSLIESGSFLYCRNASCPSKTTGTVKVWIERLGLLHWGESTINSLCDGEDAPVRRVADLYDLTLEDLARHSSGIKFASKLYDVLHSAKSMKFSLFLSGLNVPNLGISTAVDMETNGINSIEELLSITPERLCKIPNIGKRTAEMIYNSIHDRSEDIRALSTKLNFETVKNGVLTGKSFCITGSTRIPRRGLQKMVLDNGGIVKESVVSGLSYLITNESEEFGSDKMKKAKKFGVTVISEDVFVSMVGA